MAADPSNTQSNLQDKSPFSKGRFNALYDFFREYLSLDPNRMISANFLKQEIEARFGKNAYSVPEIKASLHYVFGGGVLIDNFRLVYNGERWYPGIIFEDIPSEEIPYNWRMKPEFFALRGQEPPKHALYFRRHFCKKSPGSVLPLKLILEESQCTEEDVREHFRVADGKVYDVELKNGISFDRLDKSTATPELFLLKFCRKSSCYAIRERDLYGAFTYWRRVLPPGRNQKLQPMVFKADWEGEFVAGYKFNKRGLEWWEKYAADQEKPTLRENLHVKMD